MNRKVAPDLLADPDTSATVLHAILLAEYGDELYGDVDTEPMDPIELWSNVREDFGVTIPDENENKINALMLALSSDAFFEDPLAFVSICRSLLSGDLGDLVEGLIDDIDITIPEMLWGMLEVDLNRDDEPQFSRGVQKVIDWNISQEAADNEELDEDEVLPYYDDVVEKEKARLLHDLRILEVPAEALREAKLQPLIPEELI